MTKVPLSVISGKSPMKTVWLLISPVSLFMNSAVTNSGAAYVTSRSLHSSTEFFGGSNRWSRNDSDIVPQKSSIGEISSKISSRPDLVLMSVRPSARAASTRSRQASLPTSQSKESICRSSRSGTSMGSAIFANEIRPVVEMTVCWSSRRCARRPTVVLPRLAGGDASTPPRMLNGPESSETGRRMARANPKYSRYNRTSQAYGSRPSRTTQILRRSGKSIPPTGVLTRGDAQK